MKRGGAIALTVIGTPLVIFGLRGIAFTTGFTHLRPGELAGVAAFTLAGSAAIAVGVGRLVKPAVGIAAGVALVALAIVLFVRGRSATASRDQGFADRRTRAEAVWPACNGTPVPAAAARSDRGPRPTIVINIDSEGGHYEWAANDDAWLPVSVETTQLVACFKTEKKLVTACSYQSSTGSPQTQGVYQYVITGKVVEAKTGKVLGEKTFEGSRPDEKCADSVSVKKGELLKDKSGGMPNDRDQLTFVRGFAEDVEASGN